MTDNKFLTADEARALTEKSDPGSYVAEILEDVKEAAEAGRTSIKTYACDFGSGNLYNGQPTPLQQAVMKKLTDLGYKASIRCEERQFVDIWLQVSWE